MQSTVFITKVKLKASTQTALRRIIRDQAAADKFIRAVETAIESFRAMRRLQGVSVSSPRTFTSLCKAAKRYSNAVQQLTQQDVADLQRAFPWLLEERLYDSQAVAAAIANGGADPLGLPRAPKGRRQDGPGIILIQTLAEAFEKAGQRVGSGDRSRFVRVVETLCADEQLFGNNERLGLSDARQKVRIALERGVTNTKRLPFDAPRPLGKHHQ